MKYMRPAGWIGRFFRSHDCVARRPLLFAVPFLISALALVAIHTAAISSSVETDFDSDGMTDAYELFFGLNSTNPADACLDSDGDHLSNLQESAQLTDPFAPDTDRDAFNDDVDANPISRAYIQWGAPQFTVGDQYDYAHPDWFLRAYKNGGKWMVNLASTQSYWCVKACESNMSAVSTPQTLQMDGIGSLSIDLDRTILTNNLVYAVHFRNTPGASLYVDLLNTNGVGVVENLYGNLMTGSNADAVIYLDVPTAQFPDAAVIHLRCGEPGDLSRRSGRADGDAVANTNVMVFEGLLYIDEDGDGLDNEQEKQLGTSDYSVDTDGDGIGDYEACFHTANTNIYEPTDPDVDDDGDEAEGAKGIIYVDHARGNDAFTGRAQAVSNRQNGPKKTIRKGMAAVDADGAHTLIIKSGVYNENLDLRGKNVKVVIEGIVKL